MLCSEISVFLQMLTQMLTLIRGVYTNVHLHSWLVKKLFIWHCF